VCILGGGGALRIWGGFSILQCDITLAGYTRINAHETLLSQRAAQVKWKLPQFASSHVKGEGPSPLVGVLVTSDTSG
jgi:hypothetical protein